MVGTHTARRAAWLGLLLLIFTLTAAGFSLQVALATRDTPTPVPFLQRFLVDLPFWLPWAVLAPLVFAATTRIRAAGWPWHVQVGVHVLAAAAFHAAHVILNNLLGQGLVSLAGAKAPAPILTSLLRFPDPRTLVYGVILGAGLARTYHSQLRERELGAAALRVQLAQAQLAALKTQIQPHFLFNTLHTASALIHEDPEAADRTIGQLSDLLRRLLEDSHRQEVPLREEVDVLRTYLDILKTRFGDRISFRIELEAGTGEALVPSFILQPLVENAVRHGVAPRREGGEVTVLSRRSGDLVVISVADTGRGFGGNGEALIRRGSGLSNVRERLRLLYDRRATLTLADSPGATVELSIPLHVAPTAG